MTAQNISGQPHFAYRGNELFCEEIRLSDLAQAHGTPLFVYSKGAMLAALGAYQRGFAGRKVQICYAMKANPALGVIEVFAQAGCGFDIVSGGDMERVLTAGGQAEKIIFSGVGKTRAEMRRALEAGIGCFNVESEAELEVLNEVALSLGVCAPVSIRVNPNVDPKTHPYISTGLKDSKFGVAHERVLPTYQRAAKLAGIRVIGIDCHIGSQITQEGPYLDAVDRMLDLVQAIEAAGVPLQHIDFGGGLGIDYDGETPPDAESLWQKLLARLDARGFGQRQLMIEPGRSLVGNAGVCVSEVLYLKPGENKNFCIIDAGMNDLPRPALYQAFHRIVPLSPRQDAPQTWDVVGPICESGDWLGHDRSLAVQPGDLLAVLSSGAYCMSMASNYNSRGRAPEILVEGTQAHLIRRRETMADQMQNESLVGVKPI
ncbi:MAG: diaminopimelate decarboxylase [Gammaproteobacteria bacterium]|uniref:diaminopimelate decarboxylase n=1 Tax=Rhodoferax sp. TaxID=50421 RepID=UPI001818FF82|nr:diaminopimelate decarboxylase [Rhodoferax sp.]MBU3900100.1 diaminopimelate decarboxylase [Gammaproteobacteria bacterium]MBA3059774.1 diaminopimelate decarboxylase [Rhodoferax sp.]MBU3995938.1 diaminopimelate decarboxylase [Gammaproteobacteria bacterium]MBU4018284.1 diaminopimelate decarboxylase [Gammaproteobacteria bacterium]MBU4082138.1 diaminopimelate decarboxylase [Gammaproteobacteria bacterium]